MENEYDEFLETTSEPEKIAILLIGYDGEVKATRLQKMALITKALLEGKVPDTHGAHFFGGYSDDIDEGAESLRTEGFLQYGAGKGFSLTPDGKEVFKRISKGDKTLNDVAEKVAKMLKGLPDKEVTAITYKLFPELTKNSVIKEEMNRLGKNVNVETFKIENLK